MMCNLGVRNCYRITDKSRGTITWNKPGEGLINDTNGKQLIGFIIDNLRNDFNDLQSYYETELAKLVNSESRDQYSIDQTRKIIKFCSQLLNKENEIIKEFRKSLLDIGRTKGDNSVDEVHDLEQTYFFFVSAISSALFPDICDWIDKSFFDIGSYIGTKIRNHYVKEGASKEKLYIVIRNSKNQTKMVQVQDLEAYFREATFYSLFDTSEEIIRSCLKNISTLNQTNIVRCLDYINKPDSMSSKELMRGLLSVA
jgi:hypothetical protein